MKHYSDELQSLTSQLLRVRAVSPLLIMTLNYGLMVNKSRLDSSSPRLFIQRVADRLYGVYKVHGNYGRVFRYSRSQYQLI